MPAILIYLVVGASLGAGLGHFGKCGPGACPLTANWRRGAIYGVAIGSLFYFALGCGSDASGMNQSTANVKHVTEADFDAEVTHATVPVVADFYATWCAPCRQLAPVVDEVAGKYVGRVNFVKINVDESPKLAKQFQVESIPMLVFFKGGKAVDSSVGLIAANALAALVDRLLPTNTQTVAPAR